MTDTRVCDWLIVGITPPVFAMLAFGLAKLFDVYISKLLRLN